MPVIGMEIKSMEAKRSDDIRGNLKINNTPKIKDLKERKIQSIGKDVIGFDFEYLCKYENPEKKRGKEVGNIKIEGELLFLTEEDSKKIIKDWKKNKKLPAAIGIPALNAILRKCLSKSINIAEELGLPPPIRFPVARKASDERYVG